MQINRAPRSSDLKESALIFAALVAVFGVEIYLIVSLIAGFGFTLVVQADGLLGPGRRSTASRSSPAPARTSHCPESESIGKAVFLSCTSQDADAAWRMAEAWRQGDVEVWLDQEGGLVGGGRGDGRRVVVLAGSRRGACRKTEQPAPPTRWAGTGQCFNSPSAPTLA